MKKHLLSFTSSTAFIIVLFIAQFARGQSQYASTVIDFSSEESGCRVATSALGPPDVIGCGANCNAWAGSTADGMREYIVLGFTNPQAVTVINIYETNNPDGVDTVYLRNASTQIWNMVFTQTAFTDNTCPKVLTINIPPTPYNVDAIRIAVNSPAILGRQDIDAVQIIAPLTGPLTLYPIVANQQTGEAASGDTGVNILRLDLQIAGDSGMLTLNSLKVTSANTDDADILNVKLWTGTNTTHVTQIGTTQTFSAGSATFSGLATVLPGDTTTYLWITYDLVSTISGLPHILDAKINAGDIVITASGGAKNTGSQPPAALDPSGYITITGCTLGAIMGNQQTGYTAAGDTDVNILMLTLPVTGLSGTLTLNSLKVTTSNTIYTDVTNVKLWTGTDSNPLTQIGSAQPFSTGSATFSGLATILPGDSTTYLWITYDLAYPIFGLPHVLDAKINAGDIVITAAGGASSPGSQPPFTLYPFGYVTITSLTLGSIVANEQTGYAAASDTDVSILSLDLPVTGLSGTLTLNSLKITSGNTNDADVIDVKLWTGTNSGPVTQIGTNQTFSAGSATFSGLTDTLSLGDNYLWITYDLAFPIFGLPHILDAKINAGNIVITASNGATSPGSQPPVMLDPPGYITITSLTLGTIVANQQTGDVAAGDTDVSILSLDLPVTAGLSGSLTLNSLKVTSANTNDADVTNVKLWTGTTSGPVTQIGTSQVFSAGSATFSGLTDSLLLGDNYLWLTYDLTSPIFGLPHILKADINAGSIVITASAGATSPGSQPPIALDPVGYITITSLTLDSIVANQQTGSTVPGTTNLSILRLDLPVTGLSGTLTLNSVKVTSANTNDADLIDVKLWTGTILGPVTQIGTSQVYSAGSATFSGLATNLPGDNTTYIWITYDLVSSIAGLPHILDAKINAGDMIITASGGATSPGSQPPIPLDPVGDITIIAIIPSGITNAGQDFWFGFPYNYDTYVATYAITMSSFLNASGVVSIPGTGFNQNFTVTPGLVTRIVLPYADISDSIPDVIANTAVHVVSDSTIALFFSEESGGPRNDNSYVLQNGVLGNDYYVMSYSGFSSTSEFVIIAPGSTVRVEITPSVGTLGGHAAGIPFDTTLLPGQLFQVQSDSDLTGSRVRSLNTAHKFAVIGANAMAAVSCTGTVDPMFEQLIPVCSWGQHYVVISTPQTEDICRVLASENGTTININGYLATTLNAGQYYDTIVTPASPFFITANNPISVARILQTAQCNNTTLFEGGSPLGDPDLILVGANEQMLLDSVTFYATTINGVDSNWVQIVTRSPDINTVFLDGQNIGSSFIPLPFNISYSYTNLSIDTGAHNIITTGSGFLAYQCGLGQPTSFGCAAGVYIIPGSCSAVAPSFQASDSVICTNDCINFTNFSTNATSYQWTFAGAMTSTDTAANPQNICYLSAGTFNVTLVATNSSGSDSLSSSITVVASPPTPVINDSHTNPDTLVCSFDSLYTSYQWYDSTTVITGATNSFLVITHDGNYNLAVTNKSGCKISAGINIVSGIQNYMNDNIFSLSPNPASDQLTIHTSSSVGWNEATVSIMNVLGQVCRQEEIVNRKSEIVINISSLSPGIYFLQMKTESATDTKKFVKE